MFSYSISGKTDYSVDVPEERFEIIKKLREFQKVDARIKNLTKLKGMLSKHLNENHLVYDR